MLEKKIYRILSIGILIIPLLIFVNLNDLQKAKLSIRILGVHKENVSKFSNISELILNNNYHKCQHLKGIGMINKELLEKYINTERFNIDTTRWWNISEIYADEGEEWNSTCMINSNLPNQKFEYLLYSDSALIICSQAGGLAASIWFEFFRIDSGELKLIGELDAFNTSMFQLALSLRMDKDLIDWNSETEYGIPDLE